MVTFRPDGRGALGRVGLLCLHLDAVPETETRVLLPQGVSLHVARASLGMIDPAARLVATFGRDASLAFARSPALRSAAARLAPLDPAVTIQALTVSSYCQTAPEEAAHAEMLSAMLGGGAVVLQARAIAEALAALGARRVALLHPPWLSHEIADLGAGYFARAGFEVVDNARADVVRDLREAEARALYSWVLARVPEEAEAVAICGSSLRAIGVIEALEAALGRPVVTANQASSWAALRRMGVRERVPGYGRLFEVGG